MRLVTYGTFRQGGRLSHYLEPLREAGTSETLELKGLKLYVVGQAPGAKITDDPNDKAVVELIESDIDANEAAALLEMLDQVEGVSYGLYERNLIDTPKGKALIYTKCGDLGGCVSITDWNEWEKSSDKEKIKALKRAGKLAIAIS